MSKYSSCLVLMTKISTYLMALSLGLSLAGCSSNDPTPSRSLSPKTQLLTATNWRLASSISQVTFDVSGQPLSTTVDGYAQFPTCRRDDFMKFNVGTGTNNAWIVDEGATRCVSTGPQSRTGTWSFNTAETEITLLDPTLPVAGLQRQVVQVPQLTATTLQLVLTYLDTVNTIPRKTVATNTYTAF
jgi:hypothetical protein